MGAVSAARRTRGDGLCLSGGDRCGLLERAWAPCLIEGDRLTVEDRRLDRQRTGNSHDIDQASRHVVEAASEDPDLVAVLVDLHPDAVELGVDADLAAVQLLVGSGHIGCRRRQHRSDRLADLEAECTDSLDALGQRCDRHRAGRATQHDRPADVSQGYAARSRDGVDHGRVQRTLPDRARHQPAQEILLVSRGAGEKLADSASCAPRPNRDRTVR